jgi:hypothetical protein
VTLHLSLTHGLVDAFRLPISGDDNVEPFLKWAEHVGLEHESGRDETLIIHPLRGEPFEANPGDWLVRDFFDFFTVVPDDKFKQQFEKV